MKPFLEMIGISKTFPGVKALDHVDLHLNSGEVHVLAGENGAGKSTLMKIMTGVLRADPGGEIRVEGEPVVIKNPVHARSLGISIIYQELAVVNNLTVAENVFLAREPLLPTGLIDRTKMNADTRAVLHELGVEIDPEAMVGTLSIGQRQLIEIARAISYNSKLIIMDEPTASLSHHEASTLLRMSRKLAAQGVGIVFISHKLEEIFEIADRVTVLRDGRTVDTRPVSEMTSDLLVRLMVDRELDQLFGHHISHATDEVLMSVRNLTEKRVKDEGVFVRDVDFDLRRGEVLGFFGLVGAGRTEVMEMIFGSRPHSGEISINGKPARISSPSDAIEHGLGFVTEDRQSRGLVLGMSVRENFSLTHLSDYCSLDFVNRRKETAACADYIRALGIKTPSPEQKVLNLSGGNQQKVVLAKWAARRPQILIVDEPTRGIDIGAKAEVHTLLGKMAEEGMSIIVVSSDLPEILAISDRVIVLKEGKISGELTRENATQESVMLAATG
ncbi:MULTISPECIES: sugar ABC transporter ATP-binding protein [Thioclava]|uniref:Sugar ABC transporter ATP-binding protein n=1 Tax=Thioclava electrotropha TaxID=1549850 RepID=A0ABX6YQV7_9RHOB|nr:MULTISPECIES: sugar ABC transporter ATP-binding protein [Thioclava]MPQ92653.1 sugar ABC transporter ATP-binding protein [Thioclava sp. JE_KL1]OOY18393.1 D-xylose ABC transporter ATP-binding protein [Thioclava sp. DLFJ4-1]OOY21854.1 D-xylose ABC transporter ATP-binding protein [Thioclava sp. DLFJ5-1]OOY32764.1 D-xylose ABC transporter ATP-binding protein [Thioclava sp. F36-6]QPZ90186.1 sugar ABC transporter ATP-binding protein [Thioclava electrotropha]